MIRSAMLFDFSGHRKRGGGGGIILPPSEEKKLKETNDN